MLTDDVDLVVKKLKLPKRVGSTCNNSRRVKLGVAALTMIASTSKGTDGQHMHNHGARRLYRCRSID